MLFAIGYITFLLYMYVLIFVDYTTTGSRAGVEKTQGECWAVVEETGASGTAVDGHQQGELTIIARLYSDTIHLQYTDWGRNGYYGIMYTGNSPSHCDNHQNQTRDQLEAAYYLHHEKVGLSLSLSDL